MNRNVDQPMQRSIGRVNINVLAWDEAIKDVVGSLESRTPTFITFCNAHTVNLAAASDEFAAVLSRAKAFNDGIGVDLASRFLHGEPFPDNLAGTDIVPAVLDQCPSTLRLFLLGSGPGVAERAGRTLASRGLGHQVVGTHHGFFAADEEDDLRTMIAQAGPDLILVGMGQPRQEFWAARNFASFKAVTLCVGALFEFAAGTVPRAPRWMRTCRVEWIYRLLVEPRRLWRRYLIGNIQFAGEVVRQRQDQHAGR